MKSKRAKIHDNIVPLIVFFLSFNSLTALSASLPVIQAMTTTSKTYLITPNYAYKPGQGMLGLGNIISNPMNPRISLMSAERHALKESYDNDDHKVTDALPTVEVLAGSDRWSCVAKAYRTKSTGARATVVQFFQLGAAAEDNSAESHVYTCKGIRTLEITPSQKYIDARMDGLRSYMEKGKMKKKVRQT